MTQLELDMPFKEPHIERLRLRVRELEATLGLINHTTGALELSPTSSRILALMMRLPYLTPEILRERLSIARDVKVSIHRLRKRLKPHGIEIKSKHSVGYWLEPEMKDKVRALTAEYRAKQELP